MKKTRVTSIEIETASGKKVHLSLDEAKELHQQLKELFARDIHYIPSSPLRDNPSPPYPCYPYHPWINQPHWKYNTDSTTNTEYKYRGDSGLGMTYKTST